MSGPAAAAPCIMLSAAWVVSLSVCLLVTGGPVGTGGRGLPEALERGPVSLNDMFREVEMLMEDTQHILEEAVDQIATESAKSSLTSLDQRPNYHHETVEEGTVDRDAKETNNMTRFSHMEITGQWNSLSHECIVDEDCGDLRYCLYEIENSKCLPCIPTDMPCTKDEECCSDEMCVWGQCTVNATRGTEGTICQFESDCRSDLCCAFQR
ncbi:dickkopf-related protein 3-like, partial [Diretmus argenteus]